MKRKKITLFETNVIFSSTAVFYFYRSEANDLALRLARAYTKNKDVVVVDK